jgi:PAS domain S-box-containing protein
MPVKSISVAELAQTLFEEAGDALFLFDPTSEEVIDTNPTAQRLSGFSRQQMLSMRITYLFRSEVQGGLHRLKNAFRKTGQFHSQEGFFLRHEQSGVWVPVNVTVTRLHAEPDTLGLLTARDLREQRQAQSILKKKEMELNRVLESVSDCLWSSETDAAGRWLNHYCSPVMEKLTGRPPEYFAAGPAAWFSVIHPEDLPRVQARAALFTQGQSPDDDEYRIITAAGQIRWVRSSINVSPRPEGGRRLDGVISDITARKAAEESLTQSEKKYRDLVETSNDLVWNLDSEGRFRFVNRQGAWRILGYEPEEMLGRPFTDFQQATQSHVDLQVFAQVLNGQTILQHESLLLRKDGRVVTVVANAIPWRDGDGKILGVTGTATDITLRKQVEDNLRASEVRYRTLFERNLAGVFRSTCDGNLLDCNDAFARILGYATPQEILAHHALDLYCQPHDRTALIVKLRETPHLANHELRLRRRDGSEVWILENVSLLADSAGNAILEGTIVDITQHKRTEQALKASEAKYRSLIENLQQAVFLKDRDLRFVAANTPFCRATDRAEAELIGKSDFDLYPRYLAEKYRADDLRVLQEGIRLDLEEQNQQGNRLRSVRVVKTPVKDEFGRVVGVLGIFWDITEQQALEAQLRQAQKMEAVGQLAGGVAHDFNNLLTVILGNLSFVLSRPGSSEEAHELLQHAQQAGLRAADLTRRLLGFSRSSVLRTEAYDMNSALAEILRFLSHTFDPRITLETRPAADLWRVQADPSQINQVLMNLALNARDAMPHGGRLTFETSNFRPDEDYLRLHLDARPGEFVRLSVIDSGKGMSADIRAHIFEPFFTTKDVGQGTGLGLAMVFGIVEQHAGWIECDSTPGVGTRFDLYFPRITAGATPAKAALTATAFAGNETILLVDDEASVRNLGRRVLESFGYTVLVAEDGVRALEIFRAKHDSIQLVVLDGTMPNLTGRDTLAELVDIDTKIRVLFSSGYSSEHHQIAVFPQVIGYLGKPYRMEELAGKVRECLDVPVAR